MGTRSWIGVGEAHATSRPWRPARRQVQADPPSPKPPRFPFGSAALGRKGGGLRLERLFSTRSEEVHVGYCLYGYCNQSPSRVSRPSHNVAVTL